MSSSRHQQEWNAKFYGEHDGPARCQGDCPDGCCERCWECPERIRTKAHWGANRRLCLECAATEFLEDCDGAYLPMAVVKVNNAFALWQRIKASERKATPIHISEAQVA